MTPKPADLPHEIKTIREIIESYECEDADREALARIAGSQRALEALAEMRLTSRKLKSLTLSFVQASRIKQDFRLLLAREDDARGSAEKLKVAVAELREFVKQISAPPKDPLSASIPINAEDRSNWLQALYEIEWLIKKRLQIAKETPARIGATRKKSSKVADENAAIGWLAASVQGITGRPCNRQTRVLGETLFGIREISEDRLRGALRNFT